MTEKMEPILRAVESYCAGVLEATELEATLEQKGDTRAAQTEYAAAAVTDNRRERDYLIMRAAAAGEQRSR